MNFINNNKNLRDNLIIQTINIIFIGIIFYYSPIDYECDAANTLMNAKYIYSLIFSDDTIGASYSYRAPIYKLIQILSGAFVFDSFFPIIFVHILFSLLMPSIFYFTILYINRNFALFSSILFILSFIPILHLKLILSVHSMIFAVILSNFFLIRFVYKKNISDFYIATFSSLLLLFTRFDGAFIFIGQILILSFYLLKIDLTFKIKLKHLLKSYSFIFVTIFLWMTIKAVFVLNISTPVKFIKSFTSLNHQTGAQLYWSLNNGVRHEINNLNSFNTDSKQYIKNLLILSNGPNTKKLYDHLKIFFEKDDIIEHLSFYKNRMEPIYPKNKDMSSEEMFNNHYGKFYPESSKITDNIFSENFESLHYPLHIPGFLVHMYGKPKADKLLLNASFEIIFSNEQAQKIFLRNYKDSYGSFKNLKFLVNDNYPSNFTTPWYNLKIFNSANCAKSSLSNKMFDQYEYQYSKNSNSQMSNYIEQIASTNKTILRNLIGPSILIFLVFIFFTNKFFLVFVLFASYNVTLLFLSIMASLVVNTKSETYTLVIAFLILLFLLSGFLNLIKKLNIFKS